MRRQGGRHQGARASAPPPLRGPPVGRGRDLNEPPYKIRGHHESSALHKMQAVTGFRPCAAAPLRGWQPPKDEGARFVGNR